MTTRTGITLSFVLGALFMFSVPGSASAWNCVGTGGGCGGVNYDPEVFITATPMNITAGESTFVQFSVPPGIDQCVADFPYTPGTPYSEYDMNTYGNHTDYPTVTKTYSVTCRKFVSGDQNGNVYTTSSASVTVNVTPATNVDLTAAAPAPTTFTGGVQATVTSIISNVGIEPTPSGFTNLLQVAVSADVQSLPIDYATFARGTAVPASSNFTASFSFTPSAVSSAQTWYLRTCADKSSAANTGQINESAEANNCSPWTAVTINPSGFQCSDTQDNDDDGLTDTNDGDCTGGTDPTEGVQKTLSCVVDPSTVVVGGTAVYTVTPSTGSPSYSWNPEGGQSCAPGNGSTKSCTFASAGNYNMSVSATGYTGGQCPAVAAGVCSASSVNVTASPDRVASGGSSTITWGADSGCSCSLSGPGVSSNANSGSQLVSGITTKSVYTLSCSGNTDTAIVNTIPRFEEF